MHTKLFVFTFFISCVIVLHAQWIPTNGPNGGIINCFAVNGNNFYVGTDLRGVFVTSNNGKNWFAINGDKIYAEILCLAVKDEMLFAGTASGLYATSDNGNTWTDAGFAYKRVSAIAAVGNYLFANVNNDSTFASTDKGKTWFETGGILGRNISTFVVYGNKLYAGTAFNGIILSTDYGKNWMEISNGLPKNFGVQSLVHSNGNLYAVINNEIFISPNNGVSWVKKKY